MVNPSVVRLRLNFPPLLRRCLLLVCAAACACAPKVASPGHPVPYKVDLTREELEEIRTAAIQYYEEKKPERWEDFVVLLRRGALFTQSENPDFGPAIGVWHFEDQRGDRIDLVWRPALALFYGLRLEKQAGKWIAVEHYEGGGAHQPRSAHLRR